MADGVFGLTKDLERETAGVWAKVRDHVTPLEWPEQARLISEINRLKRERDAVILAHNYMTPEIFHGVGDYVGDSLGLAKEAARSDARVIVQAGVHFMAETSKILSPEKTVLIPDPARGLFAGLLDHGGGRAADQAALSGPAGHHLCQYDRRGEGRDRHLLHQRQRRAGGGMGGQGMARGPRHPDPGRVPGAQCRGPDDGGDHRLEGSLRGPQTLHRPGHRRHARRLARRRGSGPPRMPGRDSGCVRLRRIDGGHDRLCRTAQTQAGGADHRMFDGVQHKRRRAQRGVRRPLQPVPAHEADHAPEHPRLSGEPAVRSDGARGDDRTRASGGAADDRPCRRPPFRRATTSSRRAITSMWS